jgi:uncharacterized protein (DUF433 family)
MNAKPASLRIPDSTRNAIDDVCRRTGRTFSSLANEMLAEAVKMRRIPGITFQDAPSGRTAIIAGTGLAIWEVVRSYRDAERNWEDLKAEYEWLSEAQLRAALAYAEAYAAEIDACLAQNSFWTPERTWATYPFMRPPWA